MCNEHGMIFDDGVTSRLGENHYHMTTTTAQAANVLSHLEYYLQIVWPELNVNVVSSTEQWAGAAIAGPKSRNLSETLNYLPVLMLIHCLVIVRSTLGLAISAMKSLFNVS